MIEQSIRIKNLEITGRVYMPPLGTYKCTEEGKVTGEILDYYAIRARNPHIGLMITEHSYITAGGRAKPRQLSISNDDDIEGLSQLTEVIHAGGAKAICQLNHAGAAVNPELEQICPVAPSAVVLPVKPPVREEAPRELTTDEIADIVRAFADAATRAKKAGYDGVEIHSAHAYLLNQFYSPMTNVRNDSYGGSLENRIRLHCEVIRAVRNAVGEDYPIALRLGGCDYREGGSTIEDAVCAAKIFEREGVDLIDLSGGICRYTVPGKNEPGYFRDMSEAVKKAVSTPVAVAGGVKTLQEAEQLLIEGVADLIGVAREMFKNPSWEMA